MQQGLQIGEAARRSGLAATAIRYYEESGVLPEPERTDSGYRGYDNDDIDLLRFVARLRALEFPLADVREIVALRRDGKAPCGKVRATISREAAAIQSRIADLRRLEQELRALEAESKDLPDSWPSACVCDVVDPVRTAKDLA